MTIARELLRTVQLLPDLPRAIPLSACGDLREGWECLERGAKCRVGLGKDLHCGSLPGGCGAAAPIIAKPVVSPSATALPSPSDDPQCSRCVGAWDMHPRTGRG